MGRLGPLVGREAETAALRALAAEGRPLITVTGPAGVGKSRLAREALQAGDGLTTILAAGADAATLVGEIARQLSGVDVEAGTDGIARLAAAMGGREARVLLDDVDDLGDDASVLGELLDAVTGLQLVVTGRSRLRLRGETTLRIEPLPVPAEDRLSVLRSNPSVRLFERCAREADPSFALGDATATAVGRICRAADGIPLALELAAGWLRTLDVETVATRVASSLELYVSDEIDRPARQRSLATAVAWSIAVCTPLQREVLDVLAAFPGGLPLSAVGELLDGGTSVDVLGQLVERSLARTTTGPDPRIALLGPVRRAVLDQLSEAGRSDTTAVRLSGWALRVASDQSERLRDDAAGDAVGRLDDEIANLRAGFDAALGQGDRATVMELVALLGPFFRLTGRGHEMLGWLARAEALAADARDRARLGAHRAAAWRDAGDPMRASDEARRGLDDAIASGDEAAIAESTASYAWASMMLGWDRELAARFDTLGTIVERSTDEHRARFRHAQANAALVAGDLDAADRHGRAARVLYGERPAPIDRVRLEIDLGRIAASRGDMADADACFGRATKLAAGHGHLSIELVRGLASAAQVALERRDTARAVRLAGDAHTAAVDLRSRFDQAQVALVLGMALADNGQPADARTTLAGSLRLLAELGADLVLADAVLSLTLLPEPVAPPPEVALRLAAAALAAAPDLLDRSAAHWHERAEGVRLRAVDRCGVDRADDAVRTGRSLPLEQAVGEALGWLERRDEETSVVDAPFGCLSPREREVLSLVARGLTDKQIAERLVLGVRTVNTHVSTMLRKLGVSRRSDAAAWAIDHGL